MNDHAFNKIVFKDSTEFFHRKYSDFNNNLMYFTLSVKIRLQFMYQFK